MELTHQHVLSYNPKKYGCHINKCYTDVTAFLFIKYFQYYL